MRLLNCSEGLHIGWKGVFVTDYGRIRSKHIKGSNAIY